MEKIIDEGFEPEDITVEEEAPAVEPTVASISKTSSGEDLLLAEIDAFRCKATQLQQLIQAKERQAAELEALVRQKEAANKALQEELNRKQEEADSLVADVETQVDRMMQVVKANMDQLEVDIKDQVNNNQDSYDEQQKNLQDTLRSVSDGLDTIQSELFEKTHSESVHLYRLIQDLLKEHDDSAEAARRSTEYYNSLKKRCVVLTVITVLSLGVSVASLLSMLGIF